MNRKQISAVIFAMVICAALGMGVSYYVSNQTVRNNNPGIEGLLWPNPKQLKPFVSVDDNGNDFGLDQLLGKWSFLFFGYTHCPDVCPLTLAVFNQVLQQLKQDGKAGQAQMIFVSVDPARDTPQRLKAFVKYFNKDIIGLGGTDAQIKNLTSQLGIFYRLGKKSPSGDYSVEHSAQIFLVDPKGRLVSIFSPPLAAGDIVARYRQIRVFIQGQPVS
jgi:protein SCO1/2